MSIVDNTYMKKEQTVSPQCHHFDVISYFTYLLFMAVLGLHFCVQAFSSCGEWGRLSGCNALASPCSGFSRCGARGLGKQALVIAGHGLGSCSLGLESTGLVVTKHAPSCPMDVGSSWTDQGSNLWPPHRQADSSTQRHQGSPLPILFLNQ